MRYDDRLATVLRLRPVGQSVARIQHRQLLDLLGTSPADANSQMLDAAYLRLAETSGGIAAPERAAMLRQPGLRLRSARLVAQLARAEPQVARAAIHAAALIDEQWVDLIPALPHSTLAHLRERDDLGEGPRHLLARLGVTGHGLPSPQTPAAPKLAPEPPAPEAPAPKPAPSPAPAATPATPLPSTARHTGAIVQRIEAFRRNRAAHAAAPSDAPRLPLGEEALAPSARPITTVDFASDAEGRLIWCERDVAPMLIGLSLGDTPAIHAAIRHHQPLRVAHLALVGAGAIAGDWQVDAAPRFDPVGGRFVGHLGRLRRAVDLPALPPPAPDDSQSDRLRQLLHELRTPVNAVQGFAEIIQQQLFGHVPHEYRALAAHIAADAAQMLAGFEELERYAKLDAGAAELTSGEADLGACAEAIIAQLSAHTTPRASGFALTFSPTRTPTRTPTRIATPIAIAAIEAERLCWRLLATLAAHLGLNETCAIEITQAGQEAVMTMQLPKSLAARDDAALFHTLTNTGPQSPSASMFGTGFALRLASAEARSAGGSLRRAGDLLQLNLPALAPHATQADLATPIAASPA